MVRGQARLTRRRFLVGTLAITAASGAGAKAASAAPAAPYIVCHRDSQNHHQVSALGAGGDVRFTRPLPGRGHAFALHPWRPHAIVLARRPGTFALVLDHETGTVVHELHATPGRHFYGHGVFSHDGGWLYTTENDFESGRGVIGVRDAEHGYRHVGEMDSHGVGPHEVRLMPDRHTLVVANGGIRTHPDRGRDKLNLDSMRPTLALIDSRSGDLDDSFSLPPGSSRLSLRHLDVADGARVAVAMQYEGPASDPVPLLAILGPSGLTPCPMPGSLAGRTRNYVGSVGFDSSGTRVATTHPRDGLVLVWDAHEGEVLAEARLFDACGVAPGSTPGQFVVTGDGGRFASLDDTGIPFSLDDHPGISWDNHLARIA